MPLKGTKNLVTKKVLDLDKKTCDYLLRKIYDDMSHKDYKTEMLQRAR
jgi:catalase